MNTLKRLLLILLTAGTALFAGFTNIDCTNEGNLTVLRITEGDCKAIESFWDATGQGAGWRDTTGWDELPLRSVTEWAGNHHIHDDKNALRSFYPQALNISGNIENVRFDYFTDIWHIGVKLNNITGNPPKNFPKSVEIIKLYGNQFTGSIPKSYANLSNLKTLLVFNNNLSGPLPDLSVLTELKEFKLYHNRFTFADIEPQMGWIASVNEPYYVAQGVDRDYGNDSVCRHTYIDESKNIIYFDKILTIEPSVPENNISNNDRYTWYKTDIATPLVIDGNRTYIKTDATPSDAGEYYYEAKNLVVTRTDLGSNDYQGRLYLCGTRSGQTDMNGNIIADIGIQAIHDHTPKVSNNTPPHTATEGETYTYHTAISDADTADTLSVTASNLPVWLTLSTDQTQFTLSGTPDTAGDYDINITVTDGKIPVHISYTLHVNEGIPVGFTKEGDTYTHNSTNNSIAGLELFTVVDGGLLLQDSCTQTLGAYLQLEDDGTLHTGYQQCSDHSIKHPTLSSVYPAQTHASLLSDSILVELPLTQDITIGEN